MDQAEIDALVRVQEIYLEKIGPDLSAVKKGYQKDYEALAVFFAETIERGRAGA
jgi:hypothetical protein